MNFFYGYMLLCWSAITESSADVLMDPLRVLTRNFPPYMYQDNEGNFYNGMEFQLLKRLANMLNRTIHFQATSDHSDMCNNVTMK